MPDLSHTLQFIHEAPPPAADGTAGNIGVVPFDERKLIIDHLRPIAGGGFIKEDVLMPDLYLEPYDGPSADEFLDPDRRERCSSAPQRRRRFCDASPVPPVSSGRPRPPPGPCHRSGTPGMACWVITGCCGFRISASVTSPGRMISSGTWACAYTRIQWPSTPSSRALS